MDRRPVVEASKYSGSTDIAITPSNSPLASTSRRLSTMRGCLERKPANGPEMDSPWTVPAWCSLK
jgi:hypothetical protein